jgi:hypothetical protein
LREAVLDPRHRALDDLAIDQLDTLIGSIEQIGQGLEFECFHRCRSAGFNIDV